MGNYVNITTNEWGVMAGKLSFDFMSRCLSYNKGSGKFIWLERTPDMFDDTGRGSLWRCRKFNATFAGKEAFTANSDGYRVSNFYGKVLKAHRTAWLLHYGEWPHGDLDHIDRDRSNNRISNLRLAERIENNRNVSSAFGASSKYLGVYWSRGKSRWVANIKVGGKTRYIGAFTSEVDAALAYNEAAMRSFGEFASLNNA